MKFLIVILAALVARQAFGAAPELSKQIKTTVKIFENGKLRDQPQIVSLVNEPATIEVGEEPGIPDLKLTVNVTKPGSSTDQREDLAINLNLERTRNHRTNKFSTKVVLPSGDEVLLPLSEKDHLYFTLHSEVVKAESCAE